jgi:hypothetical protein
MSDTCRVEFGEIDLTQPNPILSKTVIDTDDPSELKDMLVEYVGNKKQPGDDQVTVDLIMEVMADEFPEFVLALAEENFIRGYSQALTDVDVGQKLYQEEMAKLDEQPD